jgi:hypothetical protein
MIPKNPKAINNSWKVSRNMKRIPHFPLELRLNRINRGILFFRWRNVRRLPWQSMWWTVQQKEEWCNNRIPKKNDQILLARNWMIHGDDS